MLRIKAAHVTAETHEPDNVWSSGRSYKAVKYGFVFMVCMDKIGVWERKSSEYLWQECLYWAKAGCLNFSSLFSSHWRKKYEIKIENKS